MENNPNAESDTPSSPEDAVPASPSTESSPTEVPAPAVAPSPEEQVISAEAEGIPEPLAEVAAETAPAPEAPQEATNEESSSGEPESAAESTPASEETEAEEPSAEAAGGGETSEEVPFDALAALAAQAQTGRLSPSDEERTTTLLKEALLDGRAGVIRAIDALQKLPWVIGVNAVSAVWPTMKPAFRTQLLAGLARADSDNARRMRLSLARGLFKQDVPIALKIAATVSKELRNKETGALSTKHAQIFSNVLIGRAKPWVGQLPLTDIRPVDAEVIVHCALYAAFSLPHAPITQLGLIKWASEAGRLGKLHPVVVEAATKSLSRWSGKWQNALRKEVSDLPEAFLVVLKAPAPGESGEGQTAAEHGQRDDSGHRAPREAGPDDPEPDAEGEAAATAAEGAIAEGSEPDADSAEALAEGTSGGSEARGENQGQQKQRPVYESKTVPRKPQQERERGQQGGQHQQGQGQQGQNQPSQGGGKSGIRDASIPELLRQVEAQFQSLRSELQKSESKLRQKDEELRRAQKRPNERSSAPIIEGEPTPEELARLNRQLEGRNMELQARIEELLADSEARAVSVGAVTGEPVNDPNAQLQTLLALKLQEDYADFLALEKESPDIVVQQHYRTVLRHVFEVLTHEGVAFAVRDEHLVETQ